MFKVLFIGFFELDFVLYLISLIIIIRLYLGILVFIIRIKFV